VEHYSEQDAANRLAETLGRRQLSEGLTKYQISGVVFEIKKALYVKGFSRSSVEDAIAMSEAGILQASTNPR